MNWWLASSRLVLSSSRQPWNSPEDWRTMSNPVSCTLQVTKQSTPPPPLPQQPLKLKTLNTKKQKSQKATMCIRQVGSRREPRYFYLLSLVTSHLVNSLGQEVSFASMFIQCPAQRSPPSSIMRGVMLIEKQQAQGEGGFLNSLHLPFQSQNTE